MNQSQNKWYGNKSNTIKKLMKNYNNEEIISNDPTSPYIGSKLKIKFLYKIKNKKKIIEAYGSILQIRNDKILIIKIKFDVGNNKIIQKIIKLDMNGTSKTFEDNDITFLKPNKEEENSNKDDETDLPNINDIEEYCRGYLLVPFHVIENKEEKSNTVESQEASNIQQNNNNKRKHEDDEDETRITETKITEKKMNVKYITTVDLTAD